MTTELRKLIEAATPKPWKVGVEIDDDVADGGEPYAVEGYAQNSREITWQASIPIVYVAADDRRDANAALIVHLVNRASAIADLIGAAEELLRHFTKTPSSLADTEIRGKMHQALAALKETEHDH